jgi:dolichol-phosphate mannosyltransferase
MPPLRTLSILIPVYNEEGTIGPLLERVLSADVGAEKEVIVVNDGSHDGTARVLDGYRDSIRLITHEVNRGKGAALRTALAHATGDFIVPQDADLEYSPEDLKRLVAAAENHGVRVVFGSRRLERSNRTHSSFAFFLGGIFLTRLSNAIFGLHLTDQPTCYKMIARPLIERMDLQCDGFEFCAEVTAKVARMHERIVEVPIAYNPRHFNEGKKIRARDGWIAIQTFIRYLRWNPRPMDRTSRGT